MKYRRNIGLSIENTKNNISFSNNLLQNLEGSFTQNV